MKQSKDLRHEILPQQSVAQNASIDIVKAGDPPIRIDASTLITMRFLTFLSFSILSVSAIPQRGQKSARAGLSPPQANARAPDGSTIIDREVTINGLLLRYKVSAPASSILTNGQAPTSDGQKLGINLLLHGDGGASFSAFPNSNVQGGLAGVVVLAPNEALLWGGQSTNAVQRPDGVAHATAIDKLIQEELPKVLDFDPSKVWFSGVSGGSLLLSGFFMPMFMSKYRTGVMLMCGGMSPPANRAGLMNSLDPETLSSMRVHWESSQQELSSLKTTIPQGIMYFENLARQSGMSDAGIDLKQTADATPTAGHCAFDNQGFNSGIQVVVDSWSKVMLAGGDGQVKGLGMVSKGVVGRERLFTR